jgi:hypothetical protein
VSLTVLPVSEVEEIYTHMMGRVSGKGNVFRIMPYDGYSTSMGISTTLFCIDVVTLATVVVTMETLSRYTPPEFSLVVNLHRSHPCVICGEAGGRRRKVVRVTGCDLVGTVMCNLCKEHGHFTAMSLAHTRLVPDMLPVERWGNRWLPMSGCRACRVKGVGEMATYYRYSAPKTMHVEVMACSEVGCDASPHTDLPQVEWRDPVSIPDETFVESLFSFA